MTGSVASVFHMVVIEATRISCKYDSSETLRDLTFRIESGNFIGVLGPNGAGKTTLIRALSRALKPTRGSILLDSTDVYSMSQRDIARSIAVVPQDIAITFSFRALDVVLMGRNPHLSFFQMEAHRDLAIAEEAMRLTNCWHLAQRRLDELSGGERRKVLIARALAQEPRILLLDEPTLHLDICNQIETMELLKFLAKERQIAIMAVLHDLTLAARYCDSLVVLKEGRIFAAGTVNDVLTEENIRSIFRVNADLRRDERTGALRIEPTSLIEKSPFMQVEP